MKQFLLNRWFLFVLVLALVVGSWQWALLSPLLELKLLRYAIVSSVLFFMALPLEASVIRRTFQRPLAPALGVLVNIGLLPLFAWGAAWFLPDRLALGLLVAAATPCTLASASVWTRRAGGNDSVATMVTVVSSLLCFVVTPLWLWAMTGKDVRGEDVHVRELDPAQMILQLGLLVVLPMTLGQLLRLYRPLGVWTTRHKVGLSTLAQCGVLMMVLLGAIRTGQDLSRPEERPLWYEFGFMVAAVMGTHVAMFFAGLGLGRLIGLPREERIAVAFAGSQKTLMVGLQVSIEIGASVLPMVVYHVGQLVVDTLLADWLRKKTDREQLAKPPANDSPPQEY